MRAGGFQSEAFIKRIQPWYDRLGLHTSVGKLIILELPDMRQWSRKIVIERTDFFEPESSMAVAISADLQMKTMLTADLDRE